MHPLLFKLFNDRGFPVTDFFAGEVLGVDGLFLQNRLQFLGHAVKEHLVDQKHLAVKVVVCERQLILRFIEGIRKNRENRVFFARHHALL